MLALIAQTTVIALAASFFVGGQELRRIFGRVRMPKDESVVYATEEVVFGTAATISCSSRGRSSCCLGSSADEGRARHRPDGTLARYYPLIAYMGLVIAVILIDYKAAIVRKRTYLYKGFVEIVAIVGVLLLGFELARWVRPLIALPQIFFVMLLAAGLGALMFRWIHGPTLRCLLFAGIPVVLAANFVVGGSRIGEAFTLTGVDAVLAYGFFGQVLWMFGGIALLMLFGRTAGVGTWARAWPARCRTRASRAPAPPATSARTPPARAHHDQHPVLRARLRVLDPGRQRRGGRPVGVGGADRGRGGARADGRVAARARPGRGRRRARGEGADDVLVRMAAQRRVRRTLLLSTARMPIESAFMATSSALSHFGLFAAIQGGMAGADAAALIAFVFAMPFLVHPLVFFLFGRAMEQGGQMPRVPAFALAGIGALGVAVALAVGG